MYRRILVPFVGLPQGLWTLSGAAFISFLGYMVRPFLILYLTRHLGFSIPIAATLLTTVGIGTVVGSWAGGILVDKFGPRYTLIGSFLSSSVLLWIFPFYHIGFVGSGIILLCLGFTQATFRPAYDSSVVQICPKEERGRAYALYVAVINIAAAVAMTLGGYCLAVQPNLLFELDGTTSICAAIWVIFVFPQLNSSVVTKEALTENHDQKDTATENKTITGSAPWANRAFLAICSSVLVIELVGMQEYSTFPLYMTSSYRFSTEQFGQVLAIGHILFAGLMLPITTWVKKHDPSILTALGALILGFGYGLLPFWIVALVGIVLYGFILVGQLFFYPAIVSIVMGYAEASSSRSGSYMGVYRSSQAIASVIAPAIGGWLYTSLSAEALWVTCGVIGLIVSASFTIKWFGSSNTLAITKKING